MDHRGLVSPQRNARDVASRLGKELVFSRERGAGPRGMPHFAGMPYNGSSVSPPVDVRAIPVFWKEPDQPVRTPPGSGGPPAVIQVFTPVHVVDQVPLIFRSGGDSRDRKDRESPLALLSPQCRRGRAVKETKHGEFCSLKKSVADSIYGHSADKEFS